MNLEELIVLKVWKIVWGIHLRFEILYGVIEVTICDTSNDYQILIHTWAEVIIYEDVLCDYILDLSCEVWVVKFVL